eukprot:gene31202-35217_t
MFAGTPAKGTKDDIMFEKTHDLEEATDSAELHSQDSTNSVEPFYEEEEVRAEECVVAPVDELHLPAPSALSTFAPAPVGHTTRRQSVAHGIRVLNALQETHKADQAETKTDDSWSNQSHSMSMSVSTAYKPKHSKLHSSMSSHSLTPSEERAFCEGFGSDDDESERESEESEVIMETGVKEEEDKDHGEEENDEEGSEGESNESHSLEGSEQDSEQEEGDLHSETEQDEGSMSDSEQDE